MRHFFLLTGSVVVSALLLSQQLAAAVLPEDRADVLYHSYDGGGVKIDGPSVLVRKSIKGKFSVSANYYVDNVTSASIDVELSASEYTERREEKSVGIDYLHDKTIISMGVTNSEENDYSANAFRFDVSQDFFGGLSTLSMGYSRGSDEVGQNSDPEFEEEVDRQHYRFGLSQVLTKNTLLSLNYEAITSEGFLNNPYRQVRFVDPNDANNFQLENEVYPNTRTSDAVALGLIYYLPYRAALKTKARYYTDDWGIDGMTAELGYTHPFRNRWIFDIKYRYYDQSAADFYNDLFPRADFQDYKARDKELSTFTSHTLGIGVSYALNIDRINFLDRGSLSLYLDHIRFDYDDFRDATETGVAAGEESLYGFEANVIRFYFSLFY
ncbi:MAG: DUF3570 domain-containing protein [Pseudomonadales bacterium]